MLQFEFETKRKDVFSWYKNYSKCFLFVCLTPENRLFTNECLSEFTYNFQPIVLGWIWGMNKLLIQNWGKNLKSEYKCFHNFPLFDCFQILVNSLEKQSWYTNCQIHQLWIQDLNPQYQVFPILFIVNCFQMFALLSIFNSLENNQTMSCLHKYTKRRYERKGISEQTEWIL